MKIIFAAVMAWAGLACANTGMASIDLSAKSSDLARQKRYGIVFDCSKASLMEIEAGSKAMLAEYGVSQAAWRVSNDGDALRFELVDDSGYTLDLARKWKLEEEMVDLGEGVGVKPAVSKAEIALAMMANGRERRYSGEFCSASAWRQETELRQQVAAWASDLNWEWPDGGPASWNESLWDRGTPRGGIESARAALRDAFVNQKAYGIGCYTATKIVYAHSYLEHYSKQGVEALELAKKALASDGEPLVDLEHGAMWSFEEDFDPKEANRPGKVLDVDWKVMAGNFVPGDWSYMLNTDKATYAKTGYEGSNAIYLGGGKFDDYYNDHWHSYGYEEKLDEVWQWRNGVFSRIRDKDKAIALSKADFERLGRTPDEGGLVLSWRAFPRLIPVGR